MIFSLFKLDNVVKKVELISIQVRGGLTPDSVFCLKPEMGAGPPGELGRGGAVNGCVLIVCRYVDGLITRGGWFLSGGRGAYKRKFTAVECHYQMSCQKYHPKI